LSEVREKVYNFQKLPLDKSHFITEVEHEHKKGISILGSYIGYSLTQFPAQHLPAIPF
jgi:hypothetical protein